MVFNWFRRKFDESATPQGEKPSATPQQEPPAESAQVVPSEQPTQDTENDSLSWAKAAYEKIRQQQAVSEAGQGGEATVSEEAAQSATVPTVEPISEVVEGESAEAEEKLVADNSAIESTVTEVVETSSETAQEAAQSEATIPLPFWAKAEADRKARLERLKETAIEIPEPEVVQPVSVTPTTDASTSEATATPIAFDEGFLWTAEVLAAQGRRPQDVSIEEITWLKKLRQGLDKTRRNIVNQLKAIVGQGPLNQTAVMEIEALLLQADVGVEATDYIINQLQNQLRKEALPPDAAIAYLKKILRDMLDRPLQSHNPVFVPEKDTLNIWLITGVNGAGKTTTIGKIAHIAKKSGYKCLIGAADTFRAAAVEQVKVWGARSSIEVIANPGKNTDPAAVVFDAIAAAGARGTELLLIDTAGRLQNKKNLMEELSKIRRIIDKKAANAKVESLLVLDATLGQNGLRQAEIFAQAAQLSGVVLTKLDGTAKGGVALAVVQQLNLPIRFIGAGEGIEDLRPFSSYEFVEALLGT